MWEQIHFQQESIPVGCELPSCIDCTSFNSHYQMSLPKGSSNEQVWTSLQWLPPDVTSRGPWCQEGAWLGSGEVPRFDIWGDGWSQRKFSGLIFGRRGLYSEVQCIMGNDHIMTPVNRQTKRHKWKHYLPATSLAGGNESSRKYIFCTTSIFTDYTE